MTASCLGFRSLIVLGGQLATTIVIRQRIPVSLQRQLRLAISVGDPLSVMLCHVRQLQNMSHLLRARQWCQPPIQKLTSSLITVAPEANRESGAILRDLHNLGDNGQKVL